MSYLIKYETIYSLLCVFSTVGNSRFVGGPLIAFSLDYATPITARGGGVDGSIALLGSIPSAVFQPHVDGDTPTRRRGAGVLAQEFKAIRLDAAQETETFTPLDRT